MRMTSINTQGFIFSCEKPRGWQPRVGVALNCQGSRVLQAFHSGCLMCHLPHGPIWLLELQPLGLPPANRKEEEAGKQTHSVMVP